MSEGGNASRGNRRLAANSDVASDQPALEPVRGSPKLIFLVSEDWYFVSHRLELAVAARQAGYDVLIATNVSQHREQIEKAGIQICSIPIDRGGMNLLADLRTLIRVLQVYWSEKPDIVHHVALKPVIYGSLAARMLGIKHVVNTFGGMGYVFSSQRGRATLLAKLVSLLLRLALRQNRSLILVQNSDDGRHISALGFVDPARIRLIPGSGVDPMAYRHEANQTARPLVILPARLLRDKGVQEFVEAAVILLKSGINARFALVGEPDLANPSSVTESEIRMWVSDGFVEYWGWRDDMPNIFAQAHVVCLPSYHEGLPKALLEAAASGCALVTTDIPGCRDIVQQGVTGWLVEPRNSEALAIALREALENPALRKQYGAAARALISSGRFSIGHVIEQTMAVYDELLDGYS